MNESIPELGEGYRSPFEPYGTTRSERNLLAEAFIRGFIAGSENPENAGDSDAMYAAYRLWIDQTD